MSTLFEKVTQLCIGTWTKTHDLLLSCFAKTRRELDVRWKISNLTRQAVLADRVEVADSGTMRSKGLLGRNRLGPGEALWIVPCEAVHTFGMRFPIDLVYVDRKKRVRKVRSSVPPWRLSACLSAHSVIELASGTVLASKTEPDDILEFSPADSRSEVADATPEAKAE